MVTNWFVVGALNFLAGRILISTIQEIESLVLSYVGHWVRNSNFGGEELRFWSGAPGLNQVLVISGKLPLASTSQFSQLYIRVGGGYY